MSWSRTQSHFFALAPQVLWDIVGEPSALPRWNAAVRSLTPRGTASGGTPVGVAAPAAPPAAGLAEGAELDCVPNPLVLGAIHARTAPPAVVTRLEPGRLLAWRQAQPGGGLGAEWELRPVDGGTLLTQRITVDGTASLLFAETAAKPLASGFAVNCARLYRLAGGTRTRDLKVVIAGGSGFLGTRLAADLLCRGHDVVLLSRKPSQTSPFRQAWWDGRDLGAWTKELGPTASAAPTSDDAGHEPAGRVAVVNLAGKIVDSPPTQGNIAELRSSRVNATRVLAQASAALQRPVERWVQASTTAIFGDAGEDRLHEDSPLPTGPAALEQMTGVAGPWEEAAGAANAKHTTILRTSIVLEQECPAFDRLTMLTRLGLGGSVGAGRQWFSWIHLEDWLRIVRASLGEEPGIGLPAGVLIAAAPEPVRNGELMALLRERLAPGPLKRFSLPTPAPLLKLGAVALRTDPALGLTGRHTTSTVLADAGFGFRHPTLAPALADITS